MMRALLLAGAMTLIGASGAGAAPTNYYAVDAGAGPTDAHPNSTTARLNFSTAAAGINPLASPITFEGLSTGYASSYVVAPGVTATFSNVDASSSGISTNAGVMNNVSQGYNTDAGGSNFMHVAPVKIISTSVQVSSITFTFSTPISAFGAFLTGVGDGPGNLAAVYNDGDSQSLAISGATTGGILFAGFVDSGRAFSSVTLSTTIPPGTEGRDSFGVDDVLYSAANATTAVPEPASLTLLGMGVAGIAVVRRRRA